MRRVVLTIALGLLAIATTQAQLWRQEVINPKTDPNAFKISTQANLEEAMTRITRLKSELAKTNDKDERDYLIGSILDLCQSQLNEDRNVSGVVVAERKDLIVKNDYGRVDEHESVYDLPVRWQGAYSAVEEQILALGEEGLVIYENLYGARAEMLLAQAAESRNESRMRDLNRRFGLTKAGLRAARLLATLYWEEGQVSQCARALERVLGLRQILKPDQRAYLSAWVAHCYENLGERANLVKLIEQTVEIREREVNEGFGKVKLGDLLQRRLLAARDATADTIDGLGVEWVGGNYTNTGLHERPSAYEQIAWTRNLPDLAASREWNQFMTYPDPVVPPHLPIFDGSMIYVNSGDRLLGYDLIGSEGDEASWTCKPFPTYDHNWRSSEPDPAHIMPVSVYRGTVYAAIENPLTSTFHTRTPDPMFRLHSHYPKVRRALCAVDGSTGRLLWKLGGLYEGNDDETTNFLSAVVHEGTLYAIASRVRGQAEVFLYALDPDTGDIRWNLRLCYGQQETTMFGRPAREPHPSLPAIAGGKLYLCTNIGGVVRVDLASHSLDWIARYEYLPRPITKYTSTYYRPVTWYNSPTIYAEYQGKPYVIIAPTDSAKLFAVDARTGEEIWDLSRGGTGTEVNGGRALVGVRDGEIYIATDGGDRWGGSSRLHSIDISNGRVRKTLRVTPHNRGTVLMLSGRPCLAANRLLWPGQEHGTSGCVLAEVELDSMTVVDSASFVPKSYAGKGYSVFAQHGVVFTVSGRDYSAGNCQLAARFNPQSLLSAARRDYEANPDDPEAAVRFGLLTLKLGERKDALNALRSAFELASKPPANTRVREQAGRALVSTYLALADKALALKNYDDVYLNVEGARKYATTRAQLSECFLREESATLAKAKTTGNVADVEQFYRAVIEASENFGIGEDPEIPVATYARIRLADSLAKRGAGKEAVTLYQELQDSPERYKWEQTSLRTLAIERIGSLIKTYGREVYAEQDRAGAKLVADGSDESLRKCLKLYPLSLAANTAALELAFGLKERFEPEAGGELLRNTLEENAESGRESELLALLALCYADAGERLRARLLALRLLREHPNGQLKIAGQTLGFTHILKPLTEGSEEDAQADALPRLPKQMSELWARPWDVGGFTRVPNQPIAQPEPRLYISERTRSGNQLVALDATTGEPAWSQSVSVTVTDVFRTGRGTLFHQAQGFALYNDEGSEEWATPTGGTPAPVSLKGGMLVYSVRTVNTRTRKNMVRITARDVDSGGEIWAVLHEATATRWIEQTANGILVLTAADENTLLLLDAETGETLHTRTLPTQGRITVDPVLYDGQVLVADSEGRIYAYDTSTLERTNQFDTKTRFPTLFEVRDGKYVVVGLSGAALFDPKAKRNLWEIQGESVTAQEILGDTLILGVRVAASGGVIRGYNLKDGSVRFNYEIPRNDESDRIDLQNSMAFDGGIVLALADNRIQDGRMRLWGFRLLVLNDDGSVRFTWEHQTDRSPLFMQLALTDDHIALTCANTTFGFGRRE